VIGLQHKLIPPAEMARIVGAYPRADMKRRMTRCFCHIAQTKSDTTYDNFVRDVGERYIHGYRAPSPVDVIANAPFNK
jgi:hypothetical protein